jgi:hypothetical protein
MKCSPGVAARLGGQVVVLRARFVAAVAKVKLTN